jgi:hypothetical protein
MARDVIGMVTPITIFALVGRLGVGVVGKAVVTGIGSVGS